MQVEYKDKLYAEKDWKELEELVAPLHKSGTKYYTTIISHPTEELWAIPISMVKGYKDIVSEWLNKKGLELTKFSADWRPKEDLI